jgi:hypothetical protein
VVVRAEGESGGGLLDVGSIKERGKKGTFLSPQTDSSAEKKESTYRNSN